MRAARKPAEEQYQLVLEYRRSGMTDSDWCRGGDGFPIPPVPKQTNGHEKSLTLSSAF